MLQEVRTTMRKRTKAVRLLAGVILSIALLLALIPTPVRAVSWWDAAWVDRVTISADMSTIATDQTDIPILITVDAAHNFNMASIKAGGDDLVFIGPDGTTRLSTEPEGDWVDGVGGHFWVKYPLLHGGTSFTDVLYAYYNNPAATGVSYNPTDVWSNGYGAVYHMGDQTTSTIANSLGSNNGTKQAANNPLQVDGAIGYGQYFDGATSYINLGNVALWDTIATDHTWEFWVSVNSTSTGDGSIYRRFSPSGYYALYTNGNSKIEYREAGDVDSMVMSTAVTVKDDVWRYFSLTVDTAAKVGQQYTNGVAGATDGYSNNLVNQNTNLALGSRSSFGGDFLNGILDEIRMSMVKRTSDWIETTNISSTDTLLYYGDTNPEPTVTTYPATVVTMDKNGVTGVTLNGGLDSLGGYPTSANVSFQYSTDLSFSSETPVQIQLATGNYTDVSLTSLTPGGTYNYRAHGANPLGDNTSITSESFTLTMPSITTSAATGVSITAPGVSSGNFNGNVTNLGVASDTYAYVDYGPTAAYGSNTTTTTRNAIGAFAIAMPATFTAGQTYHYRMNVMNGGTVVNGGDQSFTVTLTTATTSTATAVTYDTTTHATLRGNITAMGSASSTFVRFRWGYTAACSDFVTATQTVAGVSAVAAIINGYTPDATVYYRTESITGGVSSLGAVVTFSVSSSGTGGSHSNLLGYVLLYHILPLVVAIAVCISAFLVIGKAGFAGAAGSIVMGIAAYIVVSTLARLIW